jgi:hypothetical protein
MEETAPVQDLIAKVLTTRSCTREEFKRIYKLLCKSTHPDLTGKDGMEFIKLQEIYGKIRARELSGGQPDLLDFDPHRIIRESGYQGVKDPRAALYISLYRYVASGLHSYKIRSKDVLRDRNSLIIRTVLYWASLYDEEFVQVFIDFNTRVFEQIRASRTLRQGLKGRRLFLEGLDWFFKFQDTGIHSSAKISRDKCAAAVYTMQIFGFHDAPLIPFARWLIGQIALEPVMLQKINFRCKGSGRN